MPPSISDFDFGQSMAFELPVHEPPPTPSVVYTAWHVWQALFHHNRDIKAGKKNFTVSQIFNTFQELRAVRLIQPFRRTRRGQLEFVPIRAPLKPREQAAIFLYVLSPADEHEKCSCCKAYNGSGPFRECVATGERWTGGACLNCYFTGTSSKCDLRKKHEAARRRELEDKWKIPRRLTLADVKAATPDDMETWLALIEQEERRRASRRSQAMAIT